LVDFFLNTAIVAGAMALRDSDAILEDSSFLQNRAVYMGGAVTGILEAGVARVGYLRNVSFKRCESAEFYGAALFVNYRGLYCQDVAVVGCRSRTVAGGICLKNSSAFLFRCKFVGN
jgi:hypothetical protein